jgi:hypothetical protein
MRIYLVIVSLIVCLFVADPEPLKLVPVDGLKTETLKVGQYGPFSKEAIGPRGPIWNSRIYEVEQVINEQEAMIKCYRQLPSECEEVFWLKGVSTKGWSAGKVVRLEGYFKVTKEMFVVEPETKAEQSKRLFEKSRKAVEKARELQIQEIKKRDSERQDPKR